MSRLAALQEKAWYLQIAVFGLVALLAYGAFWYFVTKGTRDETAELRVQVEALEKANAQATITAQRLNEFKALYERTQADYEDLKALLPEQRELTSVLQGIQDRARGRLSLRRFTPKEEVQQDLYSGKPIEVEVTGTYNNVGQFFAQMASYQRIVSITNFKISRIEDARRKDKLEGKTVTADFLLTAYYATPEKLQTAAPAQQAAAGQPVSPGAAHPQGTNN
jgi:type IV pilus assembly protein PilO